MQMYSNNSLKRVDRNEVIEGGKEAGWQEFLSRRKRFWNSPAPCLFMTGLLMCLEMSVHEVLLGALMIMTALAAAFPKQTHKLLTNFEGLQKKWGVIRGRGAGSSEQGGRLRQSLYSASRKAPWKGGASYPCSASLHAEEKGLLPLPPAPFPSASLMSLYAVLFAILSVIFVIDFATVPADAQFFNSAQTWMEGAFNTNGANGQTKTVIDLFFNVLRALFLLYVAISLVRVVQAFRNDEDWQTLSRTPLIIVMAVTVGDIITSMIVKTG
jgi:hypothetical protein